MSDDEIRDAMNFFDSLVKRSEPKKLDAAPITEDRYRMLLEQVQAVTFMASFEHGLTQKDIYVSPQIESLLGYTQKEWLEDPVLWYKSLHPEDKTRWDEEFAATVFAGEARRSVYRFFARDGRIVWILGDVRIQRDETGLPRFIQGVGIDVSELKEAEEKLRQRTLELEAAKEELRQAKERELAGKQQEIVHLRSVVQKESDPEQLLRGSSAGMKRVRDLARKAAPSMATVLIAGESGTGKELVARALHYTSPRAKGPFVEVNCAALPEGLAESELFGHEKDAFPGASLHIGKFEQAHGGTLFLDEIGDMPLPIQAKILRALQEHSFYRVGGKKKIDVDVRVICATNRNLEEMIPKGAFREDLYFRFQATIPIPPLRERPSDILELADHFLARANHEEKRRVKISDAATHRLNAHSWRGNARELRHVIGQAVLFCEGDMILPQDLPPAVAGRRPEPQDQARPTRLNEAVEDLERSLIVRALRDSQGVKTRAARGLGTSERNLSYKMDNLGIEALREEPWVKVH